MHGSNVLDFDVKTLGDADLHLEPLGLLLRRRVVVVHPDIGLLCHVAVLLEHGEPHKVADRGVRPSVRLVLLLHACKVERVPMLPIERARRHLDVLLDKDDGVVLRLAKLELANEADSEAQVLERLLRGRDNRADNRLVADEQRRVVARRCLESATAFRALDRHLNVDLFAFDEAKNFRHESTR
eukprot:Amastigsp_a343501_157.p2 type:complete len:184 gc:universal Amastigsp_a343501_157:460-1011(+)